MSGTSLTPTTHLHRGAPTPTPTHSHSHSVLLCVFIQGAVKVESKSFQQTPMVPTTTFIEKPNEPVPLSKLLQESPHLFHNTHTPTKHTSDSEGEGENEGQENSVSSDKDDKERENDNDGNKEREDELEDVKGKASKEFVANFSDGSSSSDEGESHLHPSKGSPDPRPSEGSTTEVSPGSVTGGDGWWTEAMAATDDLDSLVEQLEGRGQNSVSTLSTQSGHSESTHTLTYHTPSNALTTESRSPSPSRKKGPDYIAQAGKLITTALRSEFCGDYQAAFDLLKAGVDLLLNGVQSECVLFVLCVTPPPLPSLQLIIVRGGERLLAERRLSIYNMQRHYIRSILLINHPSPQNHTYCLTSRWSPF